WPYTLLLQTSHSEGPRKVASLEKSEENTKKIRGSRFGGSGYVSPSSRIIIHRKQKKLKPRIHRSHFPFPLNLLRAPKILPALQPSILQIFSSLHHTLLLNLPKSLKNFKSPKLFQTSGQWLLKSR